MINTNAFVSNSPNTLSYIYIRKTFSIAFICFLVAFSSLTRLPDTRTVPPTAVMPKVETLNWTIKRVLKFRHING